MKRTATLEAEKAQRAQLEAEAAARRAERMQREAERREQERLEEELRREEERRQAEAAERAMNAAREAAERRKAQAEVGGGARGPGGAGGAGGGTSFRSSSGYRVPSDTAAEMERRRLEAEARRRREADRAAADDAARRQREAQDSTRARAAWDRHESAWAAFERSPPGKITFATVPWPPSDTGILRMMAAQAAGAGAEGDQAKAAFRKASLRWHPDKFVAKFGSRLVGADRDRVLSRVQEISQEVNRSR